MDAYDTIQITNKLDEKMMQEVSEIFAQNFQQKLEHLWILTPSSQKAISILSQSITPHMGYVATINDKVVGFIALQTTTESFFDVKPQVLRNEFGFLGGTWRAIYQRVLHALVPKTTKTDVKVDVIAVSPEYQGKGIGRQLLDKSFIFAQNTHANRVILDVVDTNPRAKRLYVALGFEVLKEEHYGRFTRRAGFTGSTYMGKKIDADI